jgi:putative signal transducing protein
MLKKNTPQSPKWMVVYSSYDLTDAYIVSGRLEVEGIKALVHQQAGARALGITIGRLGEITVLVCPQDYERALEILESPEPDALPDNVDDVNYSWDDDE